MKRIAQLIAVVVVLLFAGCGGGGGSGVGSGGGSTHNITGTVTTLGSFGTIKPVGNLIQLSDGNLYGMTYYGGANALGTVFKINTSGVETVLYSFAGGADGANPNGTLIQASDGNLYGTTNTGGTNSKGTVFKIVTDGTAAGTTETKLYSFAGGADGANPNGSLIQASDSNLYGMTSSGGTPNFGTVFKITTGGVETMLHAFAGGTADGANPNGSLIQARDGYLYGMTGYPSGGGTNGMGTVFKINIIGGVETVLYSFAGGVDGAYPTGNLVQASDGNLYGMTFGGGANSVGTVFKIVTDGTAAGTTETKLHSFAGGTLDGANPLGDLIQASDGNLYGMTSSGGTPNFGTVFKITTAGVETMLHAFAGGTADGANNSGYGDLVQASDGNLYGMTSGSGANPGTMFKVQ